MVDTERRRERVIGQGREIYIYGSQEYSHGERGNVIVCVCMCAGQDFCSRSNTRADCGCAAQALLAPGEVRDGALHHRGEGRQPEESRDRPQERTYNRTHTYIHTYTKRMKRTTRHYNIYIREHVQGVRRDFSQLEWEMR